MAAWGNVSRGSSVQACDGHRACPLTAKQARGVPGSRCLRRFIHSLAMPAAGRAAGSASLSCSGSTPNDALTRRAYRKASGASRTPGSTTDFVSGHLDCVRHRVAITSDGYPRRYSW